FSDEELRDLLADPEEIVGGLTDEDATPEVPARPVSQAGEIWLLGKHRVLCGSATDMRDIERLMLGEQADLVFTDPPYNVDYEGYTADKLTIQGDRVKPEDLDHFLLSAFTNFAGSIKLRA